MRRIGARIIAVAMIAAACTGSSDDNKPDAAPGLDGGTGFVDKAAFRARQDDYIAFATRQYEPTSALSLLAHAERARRDNRFTFDPVKAKADLTASFAKIDDFEDTSDFDLLYLLNLWYGYRADLDPALRTSIEQRILKFKYWYDEPSPPGVIDDKYYWSENHRIIFHTLEYLAGQAFPKARFTNDGRTGAEHRAHATRLIDKWIAEKARFGFTEWHSDVYYQKDVTPLLSLVEWADDARLTERAAMVLDVVLFDIAIHLQHGNSGGTRGRSYMKDKSTALDQDVFGLSKLLFDDTTQPYQSGSDAGAVLLARARRYRLPEVIRRVATSSTTGVDRERMGVKLDPLAPIEPDPPAPYGVAFDDPENVAFWWDRGAFTAWQVVPLTLSTAEHYDLWKTKLFKPFTALRDATGNDPEVAKPLARSLAYMVGFGLLSEVNTYTWRSPDVMLSTAQDYRKGAFGEQYHAWQATLDENALVFTTHPKNEPEQGTQWPDSDGYWTGTGSMPRSAQHGTAAIHLYAPQFPSPGGPPLDAFAYLPYTHAYFPQEHFDEVVTDGPWTIGRRGNGFVALWSWRPVRWRNHDPAKVFTHGLTRPFDLVADGGADNVWIVEVGDTARWKSFAAFRAAVRGASIEVNDLGAASGISKGFAVRYQSPTEGELRFAWDGPLTVKGGEVPISDYPRFDNAWSKTAFEGKVLEIRDRDASLRLDFAAGTRRAQSGPAQSRP
jgi:hypothetical protein